MAGNVIERQLTGTRTGRIRHTVATPNDDAEIRRLLRENPMPGRISLSLEREPNYFADASQPEETKVTIIARDGGRVACVGSCTIRPRFINGTPRRVGYLGGLRLDAGHAGRFDMLRRGYELFQELQAAMPAEYYFTSIAADNDRARAFLERGLPGMPCYEFIGDYVTMVVSAGRRPPIRTSGSARIPSEEQIVSLLNAHNCRHQLAPYWSERELSGLQILGLGREDFRFVVEGERVTGSSALWDQRGFKQTVIRGYQTWLRQARPVLNFCARFTGGIELPAVGKTLSHAFVSHVAVEPDRPDIFTELIESLRGVAAHRGIKLLTLGFAANDPRLAWLRGNFRGREYRSRLYLVSWPEFGGKAHELDGRVLAPEVALI
jgi:hypothetical protein